MQTKHLIKFNTFTIKKKSSENQLPQPNKGPPQKKTTINIIVNGARLTIFPLGLGTGQGCPSSPPLYHTREPSQGNKERKRKVIRTGKEKIKLLLFEDNTTIYVEENLEFRLR